MPFHAPPRIAVPRLAAPRQAKEAKPLKILTMPEGPCHAATGRDLPNPALPSPTLPRLARPRQAARDHFDFLPGVIRFVPSVSIVSRLAAFAACNVRPFLAFANV
jgi:hypothetical protein